MRALTRTNDAERALINRTLSEADDTIDIMSALATLWRRKWLILAIVALGTMAGWYAGKSRVPLFTAQSSVLIEPRENRIVDIQRVVGRLFVDEAAIATEREVLRSRANVIRVMEDLGLFEDPEFNPAFRDYEPTLTDRILDLAESALELVPRQWLIATGVADDGQSDIDHELTPLALEDTALSPFMREVAYEIFAGRLDVTNDGLSYVIKVNFTSEDRGKAAQIANRLVEVYIENQLRSKVTVTDRATVFLESRLAELRAEVQAADAAVQQYKAEAGLLDTRGVLLSETELSDLNRTLIVARGELAERQARLRLVRDLRASGLTIDAVGDVLGNPLIISLRNREAELLRREAEISAQFGPRHPQMVQLQQDKAALQAQVRVEIDRIATALENDVRVTQARIATIESQLAGVRSQSLSDRNAEIRLLELQREADTIRALHDQFLTRFKETREEQDLIEADARIVAVAAPPVSPSTPGSRLFIMAGFTAASVLGALIALLLDRLDKGIRSSREVERLLGLPTLGLVPKVKPLKRNKRPFHYLVDKPLSAYSEAIRTIYLGIKLGSVDDPPKTVLVTSSLPEEGKTTLAFSLAVFAARSGKRVLLIDLDLRHPSIHRELGWQVGAGIVEYMLGDKGLDEVIQRDPESGLEFLPVRAQTTNPTVLIDSQRMRDLLALCREQYDLVVIDSAPVGSVSDTRALSVMVDRVIYVVQWAETPAGVVEDCVGMLHEVGARIAGVVMSRVDIAKHAKYGYGDSAQYYKRSKKYYVE